jgi:NAD(P)H-dependent FMN reductase
MKQSINFYQFAEQFQAVRPNSFSREGLIALWEYLEQFEEDTGHEIEFDVIALCGDFTEYDSLADYQQDYSDNAEDYTAAITENNGLIVYSH